MTSTLVQKKLFRGTHEYEIDGEQLNVRIKTPLKEESLSILLSVLNPEPVINRSSLEFVSRVNGEPLVSMTLAKPNPQVFNAFVSELKQRATAEYNAFSGLRPTDAPEGIAANSFEEPPQFDDDDFAMAPPKRTVNVEEVETAISMLQTHLEPEQAGTLIAALEALREAPEDYASLVKLAEAFGELGSSQGAVLTYAPYVGLLLSDDPY